MENNKKISRKISSGQSTYRYLLNLHFSLQFIELCFSWVTKKLAA